MYRRTVLPLLLALTVVLAACGGAAGPQPSNAPTTRQIDAPAPEPPAQATAESPLAPPSQAAESPLPTVAVTNSESVTGVARLDFGANDEKCILPGMVITGTDVDLPPCEPAPEATTPETTQETAMPTEAPREEPAPTEPAAADAGEPQAQGDEAARVAALAADDLAQQLGIPASEIEVREVRPVTWPDSSLGCPQPGMMYAQMEQDGYLIRLSARGEVYSYHSGGGQPPFQCEQTLQLQEPDPRATDEFIPPPGFDVSKND